VGKGVQSTLFLFSGPSCRVQGGAYLVAGWATWAHFGKSSMTLRSQTRYDQPGEILTPKKKLKKKKKKTNILNDFSVFTFLCTILL